MRSGWQVTGHKMAEGEGVVAKVQLHGTPQKLPLVDLGSLGSAVWAMLVHGLLCGDNGKETHLHVLELHIGLVHLNLQKARDDCAGRCLRRIEEDQRGGLDDHVQDGCRLGFHFGTGLWALLERVLTRAKAMALEGLHDEGFL